MRLDDQPAYVLHARAWRETSLLVEVLTQEHGRLGLLARGVQGPRKQALRAALQPLQCIRFDAVLAGELAQLRRAESQDAAPRLQGQAMLAGFYVNELVLRLAPRHDPLPELHEAYGDIRQRLAAGDELAWSLRRFERDLLEALGFGFDWTCAADGQPIDPVSVDEFRIAVADVLRLHRAGQARPDERDQHRPPPNARHDATAFLRPPRRAGFAEAGAAPASTSRR